MIHVVHFLHLRCGLLWSNNPTSTLDLDQRLEPCIRSMGSSDSSLANLPQFDPCSSVQRSRAGQGLVTGPRTRY